MKLNNERDSYEIERSKKSYKEAIDIFPALIDYKAEHSTKNLERLCKEIKDFCCDVYASTNNKEEREIYYNMLEKLVTCFVENEQKYKKRK